MDDRKEANTLGSCVWMVLLNNRMYRTGKITEEMKNKISAEILSDYQRMRSV